MPIDRDGDGPPLRRQEPKVSLTPGEGRGNDLRATPFTDDVFNDDYYGRRARRPQGSRSLSVVIGVGLGLAVAGGAAWYFLKGSALTFTPGEVAFIKAEPSPYKVKPENPGGLQVENQDKLVYDRVAKGDAPARVENLLPPAEEPKAPPLKPKVEAPLEEPPKAAASPPLPEATAPAAPAKEPPPEPLKQAIKDEPPPASGKPVPLTAPPAAPAAATPDPLAAAVAAATAGRTAATAPAAPAPTTETPPEPATAAASQTIPPPSASGGTYQIQLASVLSEQAALAEWGRISGKHKEVLGAYTPSVTKADLGERGVFYRLRAGPLADKAAADALCSSLTSVNVGCIVVKP